jgi:hypothetical protein
LLILKSIENLTDLNNIPIPCPYLTLIKLLMLNTGVAERWVNIWLFFFKEKYRDNSSENGDMSNKKEVLI